MNIQEFRKRIDEVDDQLVRLLSVRAQLAIEIGRTKMEAGMELYDPTREDEIARRVLEANPGVLDTEAITRLFREIVSESRRAAAQAANVEAAKIAATETDSAESVDDQ
jgi:chorismate mutase